MLKNNIFVIAGILSLVGCGSDNKETVVDTNTVPELNQISMALTPLKPASPQGFEQHLKNGLYLRTTMANNYELFADASNLMFAQQSNTSSTITQEAGVDEGDRIKYDGEFLFIAKEKGFIADNGNTQSSSIRILQRDNEGNVAQIADTLVSDETSRVKRLYLTEGTLAVLSEKYGLYEFSNAITDDIVILPIEPIKPFEQTFNLSLIDVADPSAPQLSLSYTIDGTLIDSRRVDNILYLVSSYSPYIPDLEYQEDNEASNNLNYQKILSTDIDKLLPKITTAQGSKIDLVDAANCLLPTEITDEDGFDTIITITAIDLKQTENISSTCINAQISGLYATPQSIYLYGTDYQYSLAQYFEKSIIHKFSIDNQNIDYIASGTLNGRFNGQLSNLRFSEDNDTLRVVTTEGNAATGYQHKLNVLDVQDDRLTVTAQLPNGTYPQKIGKISNVGIVQEDIKAVRFFESKAYVVTFLNTDPLYVIDLANNSQPKIVGTLEVPGYSSYLHPIAEDLLLGIGQNVDPDRLSILPTDVINNQDSEDDSPIIEGAKVSLFDISDMSAPIEIHSIVYPDGYTPVEFDYHALTVVRIEDNKHHFALPVEKWLSSQVKDEQSGETVDVWSRENSLALVEVSGSGANAQLLDQGQVKPTIDTDEPNNTWYISGWQDRAILHDNDIYYLHGNDIWRSDWQTPEQISGPF